MTPLQKSTHAFVAAFGVPPELSVRAPGRVNLIGEHTDYNDGFVLPCAIDFHTVVSGSPRHDGQIRVLAVDYDGECDVFDVREAIERTPAPTWANYVRGVVRFIVEAGYAPTGADLAISGNVPQGAGLSSSASMVVAVGQFFNSLHNLAIHPTDIALIGQRAENHFVGCQTGIMDQLISVSGQADHALLIDCRSLATQAVAMPRGVAVVIVDSHVRRGLVDSEYNIRRRQCEAAARYFGIKALRDLDIPTLEAGAAGLDAVAVRRARHVITDSQRAIDLAAALPSGDLKLIGRLMADSHASMRDDFEITVPAIDALVGIVKGVLGDDGGARMTGGGFGGCVVALMPGELAVRVRHAVASEYRALSGLDASIRVCHASAGAAVCR
jgi:galactokinase